MVTSLISRFGSLVAKVALATIVASIGFAAPVAAVIAFTSAPTRSNIPKCVAGEGVVDSPACVRNLAAAQQRWPNAQLKLDASEFPASGEWLVLDADGAHFNDLTVSQQLSPLAHPIARPKVVDAASGSFFKLPLPAVAFAGVVKSGSGAWSGSCGSQYSYYYRLHFSTWYGANLDLKNSGVIDFCHWVSITEIPSAWGAGIWTNTNGSYYSGAQHSWVYWTGTIWGCCSDSYQEYFQVGMYGNYSWSVQD